MYDLARTRENFCFLPFWFRVSRLISPADAKFDLIWPRFVSLLLALFRFISDGEEWRDMKIKRACGGTKRETTFMANFSLVAIQFCHVARLQRNATWPYVCDIRIVDICYVAFCHIVVPRLVPFPSRQKSERFGRKLAPALRVLIRVSHR